MRPLLKKRVAIAMVAVLAMVVSLAFFQTTYNATNAQVVIPVAGGTAFIAAGPGVPVTNFGQCSHWFSFQANGSTATLTGEAEASLDGTTWFAISLVSNSTTNGIVRATGYYPQIRYNVLTITGAGASVKVQYSGSTFCSGADGGLSGGFAPSQPVTFVAATALTNTATNASPITIASAGTPVILFGITAYNATGGTVFVVITSGAVGVTSPVVIPVPATTSFAYPLPTIGTNIPTSAGATKAYCTTSLSVPADPGTPCQITILYKQGILVNGNVLVSGTQSGNQQGGGPSQ